MASSGSRAAAHAGYVDGSLDASAFDGEGYFRTRDLGGVDARGYVTITGRAKDVIIRNMENISAREVEVALLAHPDVRDAAVIGLPDEVTGERICAVIVPAEPSSPPSLGALCDHLSSGLNKRKLPEQLEVVTSLPRNAMGKVIKRQLSQELGRSHPAPH